MVGLVKRPDPRSGSRPRGTPSSGRARIRVRERAPLLRLLQQTERHASTCGERNSNSVASSNFGQLATFPSFAGECACGELALGAIFSEWYPAASRPPRRSLVADGLRPRRSREARVQPATRPRGDRLEAAKARALWRSRARFSLLKHTHALALVPAAS